MGLPLSNDGKPVPSHGRQCFGLIPKGAKNAEVAKDFLKYVIQPKVNNEYLKTGLGRNIPCMQSIVKNDPWWLDPADQHRVAYVKQGLLGPTVPSFWVYNPAYAQVQNEHVWSVGLDRHHDRRNDAAGGGGKGVQARRGNLREIPDPAELRGDHEQRVGYLNSAARRSRRQSLLRYWQGRLRGSEFTWAVAFVVPYIAVFLAFVVYPVFYGAWMGSSPHLVRASCSPIRSIRRPWSTPCCSSPSE